MRVTFKQKYYIVRSGEYLKWAESFRDRFYKISEQHRTFLAEINVKGWLEYSDRPNYVIFDGTPPMDFTKPNKSKSCRPKKNTKTYKKFQALEPRPCCCAEFCKNYKFTPAITAENLYRKIGNWTNPVKLYWYDPNGLIMLVIPDVEAYLLEFKSDYVGRKLKDLQYPKIETEGLEEVSLEKWMLMQAEYKKVNKDV